MNKYNVRAIRNELDGYIRHCAWKKFRIKFQSLADDLRKAVVEYRPNNKNKTTKYNKSLLHVLCHSCSAHVHPPFPIDMLESVIQASTQHLFGIAPTPLSIALDRQASPAVVECLLLHNNNNSNNNQESSLLYIRDGKGDTPILQAVKQQQENEAIWKLLVGYDRRKQSLLLPSKKRNRIPLFYVAHHELSFVDNIEEEEELPEELEYMLLQTYQAIEIQQGRKSVAMVCTTQEIDNTINNPIEQEDYDSDYFSLDSEEEDEEEPNQHALLLLLHATIACAHFLGAKTIGKLLQFFLSRRMDNNLLRMVDSEGDSVLHHVCRAEHMFSSLEPNIVRRRVVVSEETQQQQEEEEDPALGTSFLQYLIAHHPQGLLLENSNGQLPLHVAIQTEKDWEFLQHLCQAAPSSVRKRSRRQQMALHMTLSSHYYYYYSNHHPSSAASEMIMQLWKLYPEAATIVDGTTRLLAFQLAAIPIVVKSSPSACSEQISSPVLSKQPNNNNKTKETTMSTDAHKDNKQQGLDQLSTIFFLLRASPQVLRAFI